jgi:hypothetical protein
MTAEQAPEQPPQPRPDGEGDGGLLRSAVSLLGAFGPPLTLATALLVYFGWARSYVQARELGIDESVLGMSTQDYVLRSVDTLYAPMIILAVLGLGWLLAHERVVATIQERPDAAWLHGTFAVLRMSWIALPALGMLLWAIWPGWGELVAPLTFALGVVLTGYAVAIRHRLAVATGQGGGPRTLARWHGPTVKLLAGAVVAVALFWELWLFAGVVGRGLAAAVVAGLDQRTGVVVYSAKDLHITAPGVDVTRFPGTDSAYAYRYDGLRLLQMSGGKYFLLPADWSPGEGVVVVLRDNDSLRLEFSR